MTCLFMAGLMTGSVSIPCSAVWHVLVGDEAAVSESWRFIILESRLPQMVTAMLSGACLATAGLMMQTVFRNPLAGPDVFGINGGAGLGVALVMLLAGGSVTLGTLGVTGNVAILAAAFAGAMAVMAIILFSSTLVRDGVMLLVIGIMVGYLSSSAPPNRAYARSCCGEWAVWMASPRRFCRSMSPSRWRHSCSVCSW